MLPSPISTRGRTVDAGAIVRFADAALHGVTGFRFINNSSASEAANVDFMVTLFEASNKILVSGG
jgi:hypothetical protein